MKKKIFIMLLLMNVFLWCYACGGKKVKTVTLSFVTDNGKQIEPIRFNIGEEVVLPYDLMKEGYTFAGWYTNSDRTVELKTVDIKEDTGAYAKWNPLKFTITFFYYIGKIETKAVEYDKSVDLPTDISRENYSFAGWYIDYWLTKPYDSQLVKGDMTLFAKWESTNHTVTFHYYDNITSSQTIKSGEKIVLPTDTDREGCNFAGWYLDEKFDLLFDQSIAVSSNLNLYGKWSEKIFYSVEFIDWDGSLLLETKVEEGGLIDGSELFISDLGLAFDYSVNGEIINSDTYTVLNKVTIDIIYDYPVSDKSLFTFHPFEGGYYVSEAVTLSGDIYLPPTYRGRRVIGTLPADSKKSGAFYNSPIKFVYIPLSYSIIGAYSFYECYSLETLSFNACETLVIEEYAFFSSGLTRLTLPEGIVAIGDAAFDSSLSIKTVSLPASLSSIGKAVFKYCISLSEITMAAKSEFFMSKDGNLLSADGKVFYSYAYGSMRKNFELYFTVERIDDFAFAQAHNLETIDLSGCVNLKYIGDYSFENCSRLNGIEIPDSVLSIGSYAFFQCFEVEYIRFSIDSNLTAISSFAFSDCINLSEFMIPKNAAIYVDGNISGGEVFVRCSALKRFGVSAENEYYTAVDGILFSKDMTILYAYPAGREASLYEIENTVVSIGSYAFYCSFKLVEIIFPKDITEIGHYAFAYANINKVIFPMSLKNIGVAAFWACPLLESVRFEPDSKIELLSRYSFYLCSSLSSFVLTADIPPLGPSNFIDIFSAYKNIRIYVPLKNLTLYKSVWAVYEESIFAIE